MPSSLAEFKGFVRGREGRCVWSDAQLARALRRVVHWSEPEGAEAFSEQPRDNIGRFASNQHGTTLDDGHEVEFIPHDKQRPDETTIMVHTKKLDKAWKEADAGYHLPAEGEGKSEIKGRRDDFERFLKKNEPVQASRAVLDADGGVSFVDGRHRFAVLRDRGAERVAVTVPKSQADHFRDKFGVKGHEKFSEQYHSFAVKEEDSGRWVTLEGGTHVHITNGRVDKGPPHLTGRAAHQEHAAKAVQHAIAKRPETPTQGKQEGIDHEEVKKHALNLLRALGTKPEELSPDFGKPEDIAETDHPTAPQAKPQLAGQTQPDAAKPAETSIDMPHLRKLGPGPGGTQSDERSIDPTQPRESTRAVMERILARDEAEAKHQPLTPRAKAAAANAAKLRQELDAGKYGPKEEQSGTAAQNKTSTGREATSGINGGNQRATSGSSLPKTETTRGEQTPEATGVAAGRTSPLGNASVDRTKTEEAVANGGGQSSLNPDPAAPASLEGAHALRSKANELSKPGQDADHKAATEAHEAAAKAFRVVADEQHRKHMQETGQQSHAARDIADTGREHERMAAWHRDKIGKTTQPAPDQNESRLKQEVDKLLAEDRKKGTRSKYKGPAARAIAEQDVRKKLGLTTSESAKTAQDPAAPMRLAHDRAMANVDALHGPKPAEQQVEQVKKILAGNQAAVARLESLPEGERGADHETSLKQAKQSVEGNQRRLKELGVGDEVESNKPNTTPARDGNGNPKVPAGASGQPSPRPTGGAGTSSVPTTAVPPAPDTAAASPNVSALKSAVTAKFGRTPPIAVTQALSRMAHLETALAHGFNPATPEQHQRKFSPEEMTKHRADLAKLKAEVGAAIQGKGEQGGREVSNPSDHERPSKPTDISSSGLPKGLPVKGPSGQTSGASGPDRTSSNASNPQPGLSSDFGKPNSIAETDTPGAQQVLSPNFGKPTSPAETDAGNAPKATRTGAHVPGVTPLPQRTLRTPTGHQGRETEFKNLTAKVKKLFSSLPPEKQMHGPGTAGELHNAIQARLQRMLAGTNMVGGTATPQQYHAMRIEVRELLKKLHGHRGEQFSEQDWGEWSELLQNVDIYTRAGRHADGGDGAEAKVFNEDGPADTPKTVADEIARAASETDREPSDAQKKAGNYRKGKFRLHGYTVAIETPKGAMRRGTNRDGKEWSQEMQHHYGYLLRTLSEADEDHIDVFIGPHPENETLYVVDQVNPKTGRFDEHKVMVGFHSEQEARDAYHENYEDGWQGFAAIRPVMLKDFREWVESEGTGKRIEHQELA